MAEKYGVELYEGMCVEAFIRGYVDWNPLVLGDGMSIRFDATNVRIYFYDESSYDRVDGLHVNVNHEELPVFEYAGMPPSEAAKKNMGPNRGVSSNMVINGRLDCGYCSAPITRLYGGIIGKQQSYPCPNCGCMNYVTPKITYSASTFGSQVKDALLDLVERHGGSHWDCNGDVENISMPYRGVHAELRTYNDYCYGILDGLHVNVGSTSIPVLDLKGLTPEQAATRILLRVFRECRKQREESV